MTDDVIFSTFFDMFEVGYGQKKDRYIFEKASTKMCYFSFWL
jgi:hypothetical protein